MTIEGIAGIIYQFVLNDKANQTLSYTRFKAISDELVARDPNGITKYKVHAALSLLVLLGLIDRITYKKEIIYQITSSYQVSNNTTTIIINCTASQYKRVYDNINYYIIKNYIVGAKIYYPLKMLTAIPQITKIIKNRFPEAENSNDNKPSFRHLKKLSLDGGLSKWVSLRAFEEGLNLYKVYQVNKIHFEYYFAIKNKYYRFHKSDLNTLNLIESYIGLKQGISFFKFEHNTKTLKELKYLLEPIRKVLFTTHILSTGKVPTTKEYQINDDIYTQLKRIYR